MKKLVLLLSVFFLITLSASAQKAATKNEKKSKNTGCYSKKSHSEPKNYKKKKFSLAKIFASRKENNATENEKKEPCTEPRNPYANNEPSIVKSKHGIKNY